MDYTGSSREERVHVSTDRGSARLPDAYHSAVEGKNSALFLNVCMLIWFLTSCCIFDRIYMTRARTELEILKDS